MSDEPTRENLAGSYNLRFASKAPDIRAVYEALWDGELRRTLTPAMAAGVLRAHGWQYVGADADADADADAATFDDWGAEGEWIDPEPHCCEKPPITRRDQGRRWRCSCGKVWLVHSGPLGLMPWWAECE